MGKLLYFKASEAYAKSRSEDLANILWEYKHPGEEVDKEDREYISWRNSLPLFLDAVIAAGLHDIYVIFEMKTPISNKAIDVVLVGYSAKHVHRILLVELKQWSSIYTRKVYDPNRVYIPEARESRRHPFKQLNLYANNLEHHHAGIQKERQKGVYIGIGKLAYLHNCNYVNDLKTGKYEKWATFKGVVFGKGDLEKQRLIGALKNSFISEANDYLLDVISDYEAVMGDEGLAGLEKAYKCEASLKMMADQQGIVDFINEHLQAQRENPHKEIIVISGGPGTGKTIVGIRFILEYVKLFNAGKNDNKVIFCLPKSKTVKAMFDAACSVDEEYEKEYCCYLQEISQNQNLVVVDEAHRITGLERTMDEVFAKGSKLVILLQDDHQIVRPGEEGTSRKIKEYALSRGIQFSPINEAEQKLLTLVDEKRCDEQLYKGLIKLFYDDGVQLEGAGAAVKVFHDLADLERWKDELAPHSKTKYIFPFCWAWKSMKNQGLNDIIIGDFAKEWNPEDTDEQIIWLNDNKDDRVACIYTSQGLDMDNVAFVWWDDLRWDAEKSCWVGNIDKLKDPAFKANYDATSNLWKQVKWNWQSKRYDFVENGFALAQEDVDFLIKNTYYVMLSRPRQQVGIWFKDEATKQHVLEVLGIEAE